jgi:membrane protein required for colicin V production
MALLDYIILGIVLISAIAGMVRGFLKEVIALVTWILAVWLAWHFGPILEPHLGGALRQAPYGLWVGRGIVFLAVLIFGSITGAIVSHFVRLSLFNATDRFLGFLLGLLRGVLVLGVAVVLAQAVRLDSEGWWQKSKLVRQLEPVASMLRAMAPGRIQ